MVFDNGIVINDEPKNAAPAEFSFKIPVNVDLAGDFIKCFLKAGYDVSVEQAFSDSFNTNVLDHYEISVGGDLNFDTVGETSDTE
jgi:hypothetical protein